MAGARLELNGSLPTKLCPTFIVPPTLAPVRKKILYLMSGRSDEFRQLWLVELSTPLLGCYLDEIQYHLKTEVIHLEPELTSEKIVCLMCLMPFLTIFQLYRGGQFYWWRKVEKYPMRLELSNISYPVW